MTNMLRTLNGQSRQQARTDGQCQQGGGNSKKELKRNAGDQYTVTEMKNALMNEVKEEPNE